MKEVVDMLTRSLHACREENRVELSVATLHSSRYNKVNRDLCLAPDTSDFTEVLVDNILFGNESRVLTTRKIMGDLLVLSNELLELYIHVEHNYRGFDRYAEMSKFIDEGVPISDFSGNACYLLENDDGSGIIVYEDGTIFSTNNLSVMLNNINFEKVAMYTDKDLIEVGVDTCDFAGCRLACQAHVFFRYKYEIEDTVYIARSASTAIPCVAVTKSLDVMNWYNTQKVGTEGRDANGNTYKFYYIASTLYIAYDNGDLYEVTWPTADLDSNVIAAKLAIVKL